MASRTIEEHEADLESIRSRVQEIDTEYAGEAFPDEIRAEWDTRNEEIEQKVALIAELRARQDRVTELTKDPKSLEAGASFHVRAARASDNIWDLASVRAQSRSTEEESRMLLDNSKRAVDGMHFPNERADQAECKGHLERLLAQFSEASGERSASPVTSSPRDPRCTARRSARASPAPSSPAKSSAR